MDSRQHGRMALKAALRIVLVYVVATSLWITLSGQIGLYIAPSLSQFRMFELLKGMLFVLISGGLLLLALQRFFRQRYAAEADRADLLLREQAARARVETANRAKDELLGLVSHELRTPLTAILTSTDLLDVESTLSDDQRELIATIRESVLEESRIVGDLLDATSLAAGKLDLRLDRTDVHDVIESALAEAGPSVRDKRIELKVETDAESCEILGDRKRISQVIRNLLGNALKFTPSQGTISIQTRNVDSTIEIEITDTGIGIGENVRDRLFEPFEQGDRSVTRNYGGLGLGLYLARSIVELHGGKISVKSDGAGRGSAFSVSLPVVPAVVAESRLKDPGKCRVLVVEDNADTLKLMARLLSRLHCTVIPARSAEEALRLAKEQEIDLLISDIGLPDRTGWDLMQELHASHGMPGIAISGYASSDDQERSIQAGFRTHLVKPISFASLQTAIVNSMQKPAAAEAQPTAQGK